MELEPSGPLLEAYGGEEEEEGDEDEEMVRGTSLVLVCDVTCVQGSDEGEEEESSEEEMEEEQDEGEGQVCMWNYSCAVT